MKPNTSIVAPAVEPVVELEQAASEAVSQAEEIVQMDAPATGTLDSVAQEIASDVPATEEAPATEVAPVVQESEAAKALRLRKEAVAKQLQELEDELALQEELDHLEATQPEFDLWLPAHTKIETELEEARAYVAQLEVTFEASVKANPRYVAPVVAPVVAKKQSSGDGTKKPRNLSSPVWQWRYDLTDTTAQYLISIKDPAERGNIEVRGTAGQYKGYFSTQASDERHGRYNAQVLLRDVLGDRYVVSTKENLVKSE